MSLLPRPACGAKVGSQGNAGQLSASVRPAIQLHCVVVRLGHTKSFCRFILSEPHVLSPADQLFRGHARSCFDTKIGQNAGPELPKGYHKASLREKFNTRQGHRPHFLSWCAP